MDDNADIAALLANVITGLGCEVRTAASAADFREKVQSFKPHGIVLDLMMPDADGVELLRFLSEADNTAQVLLVSGSDRKVLDVAERLGRELRLRMIGSLQKPLSILDLEQMLCRAMGLRRRIAPQELRRAIEEKEICTYFQPQVAPELERGSIKGGEALVRWNHPHYGVLGAADIIPLAEESGLIQDLTWVIIDQTMRQIRLSLDLGAATHMSVNLSPNMLEELTLPDRLQKLAVAWGVDCSLLTIEVTENAAVRNFAFAMDILTRFRLKGFALSMDDFGTGYSSLTQLVRLPFNELKIDRSFVTDIGKHRDSETVIRSTVILAHHLGMTVCAEGVETAAHAAFLRDSGVDAIQGHLISEPLPADAWASFIQGPRQHPFELDRVSGTALSRDPSGGHLETP
jgi:EAL domain-containing protein (putative c-di-GMP-specific phosphodiesterase class I)